MNEQSRLDLSVSYNVFISKVFGWMFLGLLVTALSTYLTIATPLINFLVIGKGVTFYALIIGEFALVMFLSSRITKLSTNTNRIMFIAYSILNGITLSLIVLAYHQDVAKAFLTTAITFGIMAIYGLITKTDLSGVGSILYFGIFGLIITLIVNIFLGNSMLDYIISLVGLVLFWALTAYDTQKLKAYFNYGHENPELMDKLVISGALRLYLDFINIFIFLLKLFSRRR